MSDKNALQVTKNCYLEYGKFVNSFRSIPDSRDGLKIVQRRILSTFKVIGNVGELIASPSVIGQCLMKFHPHGSSSVYGAIVNMINEVNPLLVGKGNFGFNFKGFTESTGAAAERYTKVGLNELGKAFLKLYDFSETYINENDYKEVKYIPTPIPYCLIQGTSGMGIGCSTDIPSFKLDDLKKLCLSILNEKEINYIIPYFGGGIVDISKDQLEKLHTEGECSLSIRCGFSVEESKNEIRYVIDDIPTSFVNLGKLRKVFKDEIISKEVSIKNETQSKLKLVILKNKKCKLSKEDFEKKLLKGITENTSFRILVSDNGVVRKMTPKQFVKNSLTFCLNSYSKYLNDKAFKLKEERIFTELKPEILKYLKQDLERSEIKRVFQDQYSLSDDQFDRLFSKPINSLVYNKKDIEKLNKDIELVDNELRDINKSFVKNLLNVF